MDSIIIVLIISGVLVLLFGAYLALTAPRTTKKREAEKLGLLVDYAHRGLYGGDIPENSIEAFRRAVQNGYGIEFDVRQSADGTLYIFHDDTLNRMCGIDRRFDSMTDAELADVRLGGTEYDVPLFTDVLALVDGKVPLLIELKGGMGDKTLCPAVAAVLDGYKGPFCLESFNSFLMGWFKKHRPALIRGQLYTDIKKELPALRAFADSMLINAISRPDFIAYDINHDDKPLLRLCLAVFRPIRFVWTVRDNEAYVKYRSDSKISGAIFEHILPAELRASGAVMTANNENEDSKK